MSGTIIETNVTTPTGTRTLHRGVDGKFANDPTPEVRDDDAVLTANELDATADWEAQYKTLEDQQALRVANIVRSRHILRVLSTSDNMDVAAAAQSNVNLSTNELARLHRELLLVPAGAFANPNFGSLPFDMQLDSVTEAFPDEKTVAARNPYLHPEILDILTGDEDADVAEAARETVAYLTGETVNVDLRLAS